MLAGRYIGENELLNGRHALLQDHKERGDLLLAQFDDFSVAPYCYGWHDFPVEDFVIDEPVDAPMDKVLLVNGKAHGMVVEVDAISPVYIVPLRRELSFKIEPCLKYEPIPKLVYIRDNLGFTTPRTQRFASRWWKYAYLEGTEVNDHHIVFNAPSEIIFTPEPSIIDDFDAWWKWACFKHKAPLHWVQEAWKDLTILPFQVHSHYEASNVSWHHHRRRR